MSGMNSTEKQFFALLRAGLWDAPVDTSCFPASEDTDWAELFVLAKKQTVVGLIYEAVLKLPSGLQPDADWIRQAHMHVIRMEQGNKVLNAALADIVARFDGEEIPTVLLKGQGVALSYVNPLRRQCGDIDLYVGQDNYTRSCELVKSWGIVVSGSSSESNKHFHFRWGNVTVELHRMAAVIPSPSRNRKFQKWVTGQLTGHLRQWDLNGTSIALPSPEFNALFIFYHAYYHFLSSGIGLRQLCDWVRHLHTFTHEIDRDELRRALTDFRLLHPWHVLGWIAVTQLGLPESEFPLFAPLRQGKSASDVHATPKQVAEETLRRILEAGNFGFYQPKHGKRPDGFVAGKFYSFRQMSRRLIFLYRLFPSDVNSYYMHYIFDGVMHLFVDRRKK